MPMEPRAGLPEEAPPSNLQYLYLQLCIDVVAMRQRSSSGVAGALEKDSCRELGVRAA